VSADGCYGRKGKRRNLGTEPAQRHVRFCLFAARSKRARSRLEARQIGCWTVSTKVMLWRQVDQILAAFDTWIGENRSRKNATTILPGRRA
jgi:hypothetical protein